MPTYDETEIFQPLEVNDRMMAHLACRTIKADLLCLIHLLKPYGLGTGLTAGQAFESCRQFNPCLAYLLIDAVYPVDITEESAEENHAVRLAVLAQLEVLHKD